MNYSSCRLYMYSLINLFFNDLFLLERKSPPNQYSSPINMFSSPETSKAARRAACDVTGELWRRQPSFGVGEENKFGDDENRFVRDENRFVGDEILRGALDAASPQNVEMTQMH